MERAPDRTVATELVLDVVRVRTVRLDGAPVILGARVKFPNAPEAGTVEFRCAASVEAGLVGVLGGPRRAGARWGRARSLVAREVLARRAPDGRVVLFGIRLGVRGYLESETALYLKGTDACGAAAAGARWTD